VTRPRQRTGVVARRRLGLLLLPALWLAGSGCAGPQPQARQEAAQRWNQVRAQVKVKLASDQLAAGHIEDAATELAEAFPLDPTNPELLILQARVHLARGDQYAASGLLETIEAEGPPQAEVSYLLGLIEQQRLHWNQALDHFARAAEIDPHEVAYVVAIVENILQLGEAEEALAFLRSHEDEFGWTSAYQTALAECYEQVDDWSAAAVAWEKVADAGDVRFVRERLALALYRCGRWPEAITHLQRLVSETENQAPVTLQLALAQCLLETGQPAVARGYLSQVLRDDPQNLPALQLLARAYAQQGELERARRTAERLLQLDPDSLQTLELAAGLAFRAGDKPRALQLAQRILRSFPDRENPVAQRILAWADAEPL
jgi:tetratricopeptide (TPR) repeat protein